ncbi:hypothetical protein KIPB_010285, partial [Kipferlia bialata]|eukprot:g10285.t1
MRIVVHNPGGCELLRVCCPGDIAPDTAVCELTALVGEGVVGLDQSMDEDTDTEGEGEADAEGEGEAETVRGPGTPDMVPSLTLFESTHLTPLSPSTPVGLLAALADSLGVVTLTARHEVGSSPLPPPSSHAPSPPSPVCVSPSPLCHMPTLDLDLSSAIERGPALSV